MRVLSLFDGKSSGYTALELAGKKITRYYSSEVDKYAIQVSDAIHPDQIRLGDITKWREWGLNWHGIDLILAGSPCQGFSFAGKQLAFDDPRSKLFFVFVDILNHVKALNPNVKFLLENVKMKKEFMQVIDERLGVESILINSALVSAQNRQRLYWSNIPIDEPLDKGVVLSDVLSKDVDEKYFHTPKAIEYMSRKVKGGRSHWDFAHHSDDNNEKSSCITANFYKGVPYYVLVRGRIVGRRINIETGSRDDYNKEIPITQRFEERFDSKSGCLTTVQKDNILGFNGKTVRKFTVRECFRLQTTPEHIIDKILACGVSNSQLYKIAGNGWTDEAIAHILRGLPS